MAENKKSIGKKPKDTRWIAMIVLCLGVLMIVLDTTIVNVALPSIKADLKFSESSLAWVINAYMLTFGGFLLLGGRLGDLFGHRKLFIIGIVIFTIASLTCGLSTTQEFLIISRAIQGIGGAIVSAVSLSLVMNLFTTPKERVKAMGVYGFVAAGGGSIGVLLGGFLTSSFNWHSIFLVNIPVGIIVIILSLMLLPKSNILSNKIHLDILGAITITSSLTLAVFAIVNGNEAGWLSFTTLSLLAVALSLLLIFVVVESKVKSPLIPLQIFKNRNLRVANVIAILWAASMFAWFFLSALYLQLVLGYTPLEVGLTFLPANIIMAACSISISAKIVNRFGTRIPLAAGMLIASMGLILFARAPANANFIIDVLPNMILLGIGSGIAFNPLLLSAMNSVKQEESGIASGIINTSFMMGGALGLAVLASIAASYTSSLMLSQNSQIFALLEGYHLAFIVGAIFAFVAAILAFVFLKSSNANKSEFHHL